MPKVHHVKKAQKARPAYGIEVGDSYYHWTFNYGRLHCSKTYPKQSQLTQAPCLGGMYSIQEDMAEAPSDAGLEDFRNGITERVRGLGDECQTSLDNMPKQLQEGDTGQLLRERIEAMEGWADELESIELENPDDETLIEENDIDVDDEDAEDEIAAAREEYWLRKQEEFQACESQI